MEVLKSPRPTPRFFETARNLSTKKERGTPRDQAPPRPPVKSMPSISRIFQKVHSQKARAVSFRNHHSASLSKCYDESRLELYFDQCFSLICLLGTGSFGEVFKVRSKEDGKFYAIKKSRDKFRGEVDRIQKLEEVKKHEQLPKHPNCIRFIRAWEENQHLYIQTELCKSSLSHFAEQNHEIPERLIWKYMADLLMAVKHLHDHDLIHLDIKPDNIFISEDGICKLGDFGLVVDLSNVDYLEAQEGDPRYLAPELLEGKFTKAADIFSLGITILELACDLDLPRGGDAWHPLRCGKIPQEFTQHLSPELCSIIKLMMMPNYLDRPSADTLLRNAALHHVLRERRWEVLFKKMMSIVWSYAGIIKALFVFLWFILCWPWKRWVSDTHKPPLNLSTPKRILFDCENSFSDDENLDMDQSGHVNGEMLTNSLSDSSEESHESFAIKGSSYHIRNSTPEVKRLRPSVNLSYNLSHSSLCDSSFFAHSPTTGILKNNVCNAAFDRHEDDELSKISLGPKNLMDVFDSVCDDD